MIEITQQLTGFDTIEVSVYGRQESYFEPTAACCCCAHSEEECEPGD